MKSLRGITRAFNTKSKIKIPNQEAFDFLASCIDSKFDLTSVDAISKAPKHILQKTLYNEDLDYEQSSGSTKGGSSALKECLNFANRNKVECGIENVSLINGIIPSISKIINIIKPNKVFLPTPTFGHYFQQLADNNINFEIIPTKKENNFLLDPNVLDAATKESGNKILLLCYPNNPTGALMTESNAREIADVAIKNNLIVLSDQAFSQNLLSDNENNFSVISAPKMINRSIAFFSISKMTGINIKNIGFCIGAENLIQYFSELGGYSNLNSAIVAETLKENDDNHRFFSENKKKYLQNIELVKSKISELNQKFSEIFGEEKTGKDAYVKPYISDPKIGGPYLIDFSGLKDKIFNGKEIKTGLDVAKYLLNSASVGSVPGECFMIDPDDMLVRISISKKPEIIEQAFDSIINSAIKFNTPKTSPFVTNAERMLKEQERQNY